MSDREYSFLCKKIKTVSYTLKLKDKGKKICLVCFSDMHCCRFGKNQQLLFLKISECKPDAVLISGDMLVSKRPELMNRAESFLIELAKSYKVYYSMGNHELKLKTSYTDDFNAYIGRLQLGNVIILDNRSTELTFYNCRMKIYGLSLAREFYSKRNSEKTFSTESLEYFVGRADKECYNILLAHTPEYFKAYMDWGADLVIAGHYHGGLIRLPLLGGVVSPKLKLFPKYDYGIYRQNEGAMIVTSGLGYHTYPIRIFNPSELVCIRFEE